MILTTQFELKLFKTIHPYNYLAAAAIQKSEITIKALSYAYFMVGCHGWMVGWQWIYIILSSVCSYFYVLYPLIRHLVYSMSTISVFFLSATSSSACCQFREQRHLPLLRLSQFISAQYTTWTYLSMSFGSFVEQPVYFQNLCVITHTDLEKAPVCPQLCVCLFVYMILKCTAPFSFWLFLRKAPIALPSIILNNVLYFMKKLGIYYHGNYKHI